MDRLNRIPEITDHVLSGLKADEGAKHRILLAAAKSSGNKEPARVRTVVVLCSLSLLLVLLCVLISGRIGTSRPVDLQVIPAGSHRNTAPVNLQQIIDEASELYLEDN